jgi:hypothetical protein
MTISRRTAGRQRLLARPEESGAPARRHRRRAAPRAGFSLASVLLLTAVVAVVLAALRAVWLERNELSPELAVFAAGSGLVLGLVVGIVSGAGHRRRGIGIITGGAIGSVAGAAGGLICISPGAVVVAAVGSALLIAFGLVIRKGSRQS